MADKMTCPACESHTSSILAAFNNDLPCPVCRLPADAARAVIEAEERHVSEELQQRYIEAEQRATKAEREARVLRNRLAALRAVLDESDDAFDPGGWDSP